MCPRSPPSSGNLLEIASLWSASLRSPLTARFLPRWDLRVSALPPPRPIGACWSFRGGGGRLPSSALGADSTVDSRTTEGGSARLEFNSASSRPVDRIIRSDSRTIASVTRSSAFPNLCWPSSVSRSSPSIRSRQIAVWDCNGLPRAMHRHPRQPGVSPNFSMSPFRMYILLATASGTSGSLGITSASVTSAFGTRAPSSASMLGVGSQGSPTTAITFAAFHLLCSGTPLSTHDILHIWSR